MVRVGLEDGLSLGRWLSDSEGRAREGGRGGGRGGVGERGVGVGARFGGLEAAKAREGAVGEFCDAVEVARGEGRDGVSG